MAKSMPTHSNEYQLGLYIIMRTAIRPMMLLLLKTLCILALLYEQISN